MNLIRRIFGKSSVELAWKTKSRRAPHVTPSSNHTIAQNRLNSADDADQDAQPDAPTTETESSAAETAPEPSFDASRSATDSAPAAPARPHSQQTALTYGIASHTGMVRDHNEDACFAMHWHAITVNDRPDFGFFIVADGMGGHLDGEKAAATAVQTLASEMLERIHIPMLRDFKASDSPTILDALVHAAEKANLAVIKEVPGGGTTLSTVAIVDNLAYLVHVGDSRTYLIHHNEIEQLTTDHTLVQRLVEMNELTTAEAEDYPQKNILYRAIGQNEQLKIERLIRSLPPGAQMLICSDGLWDLVDDSALKQVTLESSSPQDACDRLVVLANEHGGTDNITVIILKIPDSPPPDAAGIIDKSS